VIDVAVAGAGPSGAAFALALRQHAPSRTVVLVDPGVSREPIGEALHPAARPVLAHLGVWDRFLAQGHRPVHGSVADWGRLGESDFLGSGLGEAWHVDRAAFDRLLLEAALDAGAERYTARVREPRAEADGWDLGPVRARYLVDATGTAVVARQLGASVLAEDRLLAAAARTNDRAVEARTVIEAVAEGWWYTAAIPGGLRLTALVTDPELARAHRVATLDGWEAALARTRWMSRIVGPERPARVHARPCGSWRLAPPVGERWIAVGDAAATFDPLSSQGLLAAMRSAIYAAYAVDDALAGREEGLHRYARFVEVEHQGHARIRARRYQEEARWPDAPFWAARRGA
jgi:flavin-dependent dehydrogenase